MVLSLVQIGYKLLPLLICVHASLIFPAFSQTQPESNFDKLLRHVPGIPGEDYPIFPLAPDTSFLCEVQPVEVRVHTAHNLNSLYKNLLNKFSPLPLQGYYADPEADCQLYHVCSDSGDGIFVKFDFLCPNGTVFNQEEFVCDWWFNVDCSKTEDLYFLNIEVAEENARKQAEREEERRAGGGQERERAELSADQIEELRITGKLPEQGRSSSDQPLSAAIINPKSSQKRPRGNRNSRLSKVQQKSNTSLRKQEKGATLTIGLKTPITERRNPFSIKNQQNRNQLPQKNHQQIRPKNNRVKVQRKRPATIRGKKTARDNQRRSKTFTNFGNGQSRFGNF